MFENTLKAVLALSCVMALTGCKPGPRAAGKPEPAATIVEQPVDKTTPAYACSSEASLDTVREIILGEAEKLFEATSTTLSDAGAADLMEISLMRITGVDETIEKVSCDAQFGITVPEEVRSELQSRALISERALGGTSVPEELSKGDGSTITLQFSRQPTAAGDDYVYSVYGAKRLAVALARAAAAVVAHDRAAVAAVVPAAADVAPGPVPLFRSGEYERLNPPGELRLTEGPTGWRIELRAGSPDRGGATAADCVVEAQGKLVDDQIEGVIVSSEGQRLGPEAGGRTMNDLPPRAVVIRPAGPSVALEANVFGICGLAAYAGGVYTRSGS